MGNFSTDSFPSLRWVAADDLSNLPEAIQSIDASIRNVFGFTTSLLTKAMEISDAGAVRVANSLQIGSSAEPVIVQIKSSIPGTPGAAEDTELVTLQAIRNHGLIDLATDIAQGSATDGALLQIINGSMSWCTGQWRDLRAPLISQAFSVGSTRIDYDYDECALDFNTNARYDEEPVCVTFQLDHDYIEGSDVRVHLHWIQQEANDPNWLIQWRWMKNGEAVGSWTLAIPSVVRMFTYSSGDFGQITKFADISGTGVGISDMLQVRLFRDSANTSTLFAGGDPYTVGALGVELDVHVQVETLGSVNEYSKDG